MILTNTISADLKLSDEVGQTRTYQVADDKIQGTVDGLAALRQTIGHMLRTEQYEYPIYSLDYGLQSDDLIGKDREYVQSELQRRVSDCLLADERINSVDNFAFFADGDSLTCTFDAGSLYGTISMMREVTV